MFNSFCPFFIFVVKYPFLYVSKIWILPVEMSNQFFFFFLDFTDYSKERTM